MLLGTGEDLLEYRWHRIIRLVPEKGFRCTNG